MGPPEQIVADQFAALGFQPSIEAGADGAVQLPACATAPTATQCRENQDVVCMLHRGLTKGLLDQVAPDARR